MSKLILVILIGFLSANIHVSISASANIQISISGSNKTVNVPIKLIEDVIYDTDMFHFPSARNIPINRLFVEMFKKIIVIYSNEIIYECKKFDHKPKTGCAQRLSCVFETTECNRPRTFLYSRDIKRTFLIWQSNNDKCDILKIELSRVFTSLLSNEEQVELKSYDYSVIDKSTWTVNFYFPSLANVKHVLYITPCGLIEGTCKLNKKLETIIALTQHYSYGVFAKVCEHIYDKLAMLT